MNSFGMTFTEVHDVAGDICSVEIFLWEKVLEHYHVFFILYIHSMALKQVLVFDEKGFLLHVPPQCREMLTNVDIFLCFLSKFRLTRVNDDLQWCFCMLSQFPPFGTILILVAKFLETTKILNSAPILMSPLHFQIILLVPILVHGRYFFRFGTAIMGLTLFLLKKRIWWSWIA